MTHRAVSHSPASSFHYPNISLFLFKSYKERASQIGVRTWGKKRFQRGRDDGKMVLELRSWRISASVVRQGDGSRWARDGHERSWVHTPAFHRLSPVQYAISSGIFLPSPQLTGTPSLPTHSLPLVQPSSLYHYWGMKSFLPTLSQPAYPGRPYSSVQTQTIKLFKWGLKYKHCYSGHWESKTQDHAFQFLSDKPWPSSLQTQAQSDTSK